MNRNQKINVSMTIGEFLDLWDLCIALGNPEPLHSIIHRKSDAMQKHELYSKSKTARDDVDREQARNDYLDRIGMSQKFRWKGNNDGKSNF